MAVGAKDYIDQLLVKKYADEKVDNHDSLESMVDPNKMLEAMNDVAMVQRNMFALLGKPGFEELTQQLLARLQ